MTVGWERAAALQERESRRRSERRASLRAGRRSSDWEVQEVELQPCARCGEMTADAYLSADGEVCEVCVSEADLETALAPPSWASRVVLVGGSMPAWALGAMVYSATALGPMGLKAAVGVAGLGLFGVGWGAWSAIVSTVELRHDGRQGGLSLRSIPAALGVVSGLAAAGLGLTALVMLLA